MVVSSDHQRGKLLGSEKVLNINYFKAWISFSIWAFLGIGFMVFNYYWLVNRDSIILFIFHLLGGNPDLILFVPKEKGETIK